MGWKTILAGFIAAVGTYFQTLPSPFPIIGTVLLAIAAILAPIGIAHKFVKLNQRVDKFTKGGK